MSKLPALSSQRPCVYLTDKDNAITDSLWVAEAFGKRHGNVLRDIEVVLSNVAQCDPQLKSEFSGFLFFKQEYTDSTGRKLPAYRITEEGFSLLVMGYTGATATNYKLRFLSEFKKLQREVRNQHQQQLQPQQAADEVARLVKYTSVPVQIECVKQVAGVLVRKAPMGFGIINHHRSVMKLLTGERPSEYVAHAITDGFKVKGRSGRGALRIREPHKAATAAVLDDAVKAGKSLDDIRRSGVVSALPGAFQAILALGLMPADLAMDKAA